eukprot:CAMPEP_0167762498 /NCGR_PEP_ID=MMETSP0110_2-20121227/12804_1 /TAXON_ID=629695 /ORGANISM="Gymnochlora sp., Strain CCMP2014" /LENGTH=1142 /DNA_ID=CAMNT_0007649385 /DNA_START=1 /DNA_END=3429 /DNA_ORIENTATION=+
MDEGKQSTAMERVFNRSSGKENMAGKPPLGNSTPLSPVDPKLSSVPPDGKNMKAGASVEGEKNAKKAQSFFTNNFGSGSWRASPIMQEYIRSRSVLEVKTDIMSTLRSTSVPRASDLRQQRSKITPPPFSSVIGTSGATFETRKSTPSPLGMSTWAADVSPFTAKRRQGQGSAPPWTGIASEESWQKARSSESRTPSPQNFTASRLPFFSRSPPKLAVAAGRKAPKSDTRPERSTSSLIHIRRLSNGNRSDSKFPRGYSFRSLTPTSVMHNQKATQLKSVAQRRRLPIPLSSHIAGKSDEKKRLEIGKRFLNGFSTGGAFKLVQRPTREETSSVPRVHRLSKSLQEMGLGGQQSREAESESNQKRSIIGSLKIDELNESQTRDEPKMKVTESINKPREESKREVLATSKSTDIQAPRAQSSKKMGAEKGEYVDQKAYFDQKALKNDFEDSESKSMYGQYEHPAMMHVIQQHPQQPPVRQSHISHGGYMSRQQYIQSSSYAPPGQYSYPGPQYGVHNVPTMTVHVPMQPQIAMMPQKQPHFMHPPYPNFGGQVMPGMENTMDYRTHPTQFASGAEFGMSNVIQMGYPTGMQYAPAPAHNQVKQHESRSHSATHPSVQELQGKLSSLLNHNGGSHEIEQLLPLFEQRVTTLAKTQAGSRFLQQRIGEGHPGYFSLVMKEVFSDLPNLMMDLFGNYLCQKLIEKSNEQQKDAIIGKIASHIPDISCDRQGTRAVQKIVASTTTKKQRGMFMNAICRETDLLRLMRDPNGSHVIHAVLDKFPLSILSPIFKLAYKTSYKLAVHQHGLCVLKKCMTLAKPKDFMDLSKKVLVKVLNLVNDQYGNYLIQHIIDRSIINRQNNVDQGGDRKGASREITGDAITLLHQRLTGHYCRLSKQKFSSNVVEKCLRVGSCDWQTSIIEELMDKGNYNGNTVLSLLQDSYGNYVMQNALNVAETAQAALLVQLIKPHLGALRKNIRKKWERLITAKCHIISGNATRKQTTVQNIVAQSSKHRNSQRAGRSTRPQQAQQQHQQQQQTHHQQQQTQSKQQQGRNWNNTSNRGRMYNTDTYVPTVPNTMMQLPDALTRSQPTQVHYSSQSYPSQMHHPSAQIHSPQMHPSIPSNVIYTQNYVPQIQYAQPQQYYSTLQ